MNLRIALEWDERSGILLSKVYPLREGIENAFRDKDYGADISMIGIVMTCMDGDFKQRKRFKKNAKIFEYDILLDYFSIKNAELQEKKSIVRKQIIDTTEQTFSKYKFTDFNISAFLSDLKKIVNTVEWPV